MTDYEMGQALYSQDRDPLRSDTTECWRGWLDAYNADV